jgi:hypothetical protein
MLYALSPNQTSLELSESAVWILVAFSLTRGLLLAFLFFLAFLERDLIFCYDDVGLPVDGLTPQPTAGSAGPVPAQN